MPPDVESNEGIHERTHLLNRRVAQVWDEETQPIISSAVSKEEQALGGTAIGERLPYNDYTTIDWLHDLVMFNIYSLIVGALTHASYRLKTPSDIEQFIRNGASRPDSGKRGINAKDGLLQL